MEKIVALDMDFFCKNQSPSDDFINKEKAMCNMFWKIFIKTILKGKDFYTRGASIGKDIFIITIEKFKQPLEEMERWKEAFEETKASDQK